MFHNKSQKCINCKNIARALVSPTDFLVNTIFVKEIIKTHLWARVILNSFRDRTSRRCA